MSHSNRSQIRHDPGVLTQDFLIITIKIGFGLPSWEIFSDFFFFSPPRSKSRNISDDDVEREYARLSRLRPANRVAWTTFDVLVTGESPPLLSLPTHFTPISSYSHFVSIDAIQTTPLFLRHFFSIRFRNSPSLTSSRGFRFLTTGQFYLIRSTSSRMSHSSAVFLWRSSKADDRRFQDETDFAVEKTEIDVGFPRLRVKVFLPLFAPNVFINRSPFEPAWFRFCDPS